MSTEQPAEAEETVTQEITLLTVEPGGADAPGIYWAFTDGQEGEEIRYFGPFETEQAAIQAAESAIKEIYENLPQRNAWGIAMKMIVDIKKLHPEAKMPTYGSEGAAGADLCAVMYPDDYPSAMVVEGQEALPIGPGERRLIKTGIAIELPAGYEAQVRPRSGLALKHGITVLNTPGTIDEDYRGEIGVILYNSSLQVFYVNPGDRIAQLVIAPVRQAQFEEISGELSDSERGAGGFGSTGTK